MSFSITGECATAPRARTLLDIFTATALRCGVCTAIDAPDAQLTYRGHDEAAEAMATRLWGLGIGTGDRVGIQVRSGTSELYVAILGVVACLHYPQRDDLQLPRTTGLSRPSRPLARRPASELCANRPLRVLLALDVHVVAPRPCQDPAGKRGTHRNTALMM